MIVNLFDTRDVFRCNTRGFALARIEDDAVQFHNAIADHWVKKTALSPWLPIQLRDQRRANDGIAIGRRRRFAVKMRQSLHQICPAYNANDSIPAHDRYALDVPLFHEAHDIGERRTLADRRNVPRHNLLDLTSMGVDVFLCQATGVPTANSSANVLMVEATEEWPLGNAPNALDRPRNRAFLGQG